MYPIYHYSELRNLSALMFFNVIMDQKHEVYEDVTLRFPGVLLLLGFRFFIWLVFLFVFLYFCLFVCFGFLLFWVFLSVHMI